MTFSGFPARPRATAIPDAFFTDLLPNLTEAADLAVALCAFHALARKRGFPRYITKADLLAESGLSPYLELRNELRVAQPPSGAPSPDPELPNELRKPGTTKLQNRFPSSGSGAARPGDAVDAGLRRAVDLGMLVHLAIERDGQPLDIYFLNAPADRRGLEAVRRGDVDLGTVLPEQPPSPARSSVFALYESLVGTISPLIADELAEAERLYPAGWLEAAFREAAAQNARSWRYVSRILERWAIEGPDHETTERGAADDRYFRGKYGRILKQRLNR